MKHVGRIVTDGHPLCIGAADIAAEWDCADFSELIDSEPDSLVSTFVNTHGVRYAIFWTRTGAVELFASDREFVLVEIQDPDETPLLDLTAFDLDCLKVDPEVLKLGHFGGRIALFDAHLPGVDLDLLQLGCTHSRMSLGTVCGVPDTALIEVKTGVWSVSLFLYEEGEVTFWGLWFQHIEP